MKPTPSPIFPYVPVLSGADSLIMARTLLKHCFLCGSAPVNPQDPCVTFAGMITGERIEWQSQESGVLVVHYE
jgi:hypothetical protein